MEYWQEYCGRNGQKYDKQISKRQRPAVAIEAFYDKIFQAMGFYITYEKDKEWPIKKVEPVWYAGILDHFSVEINTNKSIKLMINGDGQWRELGKDPNEESKILGNLIQNAFDKSKN